MENSSEQPITNDNSLWWNQLIEGSLSSSHVIWQPSQTFVHTDNFHGLGLEQIVSEIDFAIQASTNSTRQSRIGVIGSTTYGFPSRTFASEGTDGVQTLVQEAAWALASVGTFGCLVVGGTLLGPQATWVDAFQQSGIPVVHVVPSAFSAMKDLHKILFDELGSPRNRPNEGWHIVIAGWNYSERNRILAVLAAQYWIVGGGPGTLLEVTEARLRNAGLIPIPGTGGLAEGMEFNGKSITTMVKKLQENPPYSVNINTWKTMLNQKSKRSFMEYRAAVKEVFSSIQTTEEALNNVWPLTEGELKAHLEYVESKNAADATS